MSNTHHFRGYHPSILRQDGAAVSLVKKIGRNKALTLLLTGEIIDARQAMQMGFVDCVIERREWGGKRPSILLERLQKNLFQELRRIRRPLQCCPSLPEEIYGRLGLNSVLIGHTFLLENHSMNSITCIE